ncbi:MAG: PAS domain-containing sensor histidine kinase [Micavibrio aeruginosavorus]|uniref:histidine kinase n=1 Tax=Micavibrio aeruginosavorus TaxID=349221 RepID=A0A2W5N3V9_9BACT|nr:MAG: PAS domain-containing sensor histidine kinase [Micavibrio aeruginosavorus]
MSIIGNDNLKGPVDVPERPGLRPGWMSGNMAQIMVFLNGLILTFTAFATLNVFIHQIVEERLNFIANEAHEHFLERFAYLESGIGGASNAISLFGAADSAKAAETILQSSYKQYYNSIIWLEGVGPERYISRPLFGAKEQATATGALAKQVIEKINRVKQGAQFVGLFGPSRMDGSTPFVLAQRVERANGLSDIVFGMADLMGPVEQKFFDSRKTIQTVTLVDAAEGVSFLTFRRTDDEVIKPFSLQYELTFAGRKISMGITVSLSKRETFLQKIPMLMFLFGLTLTLIGTLYVRNNQKQALRLSYINRELGHKNDELKHEVVEREKLYQALRRAEKENRAVIDAVSDIIFETSTEGDILFLNDTWQKITGFSAERSLGRNIFDLLYMQDQAEQRNNLAMLVKGRRQAYRAFTRLRTADGTFRAVELAVSMLRQDENKDMRVVGTITDVEERRRAERALSEAEKKYRAIVENAASGIYQVTPEGVYLSANPAMAAIMGYETSEEILRDVRNANTDIYVHPRERERQLRDALRSGSTTSECQVRRRDGTVIWVQENLRAVRDDQDQLIFYEGSMDDITQRKLTEIALREAKVESDLAYRSKSEFLANMSHELRTPLNAIIGFSDIIQNQAFGEVGRAEYLDYARDINSSGKRLLQVINDILDMSRIEAGERQLNEGVVDLHKTVLASLEMLGPKIEANRMIVSNYVGADTAKLIGEGHAIKQMLINLLSNAVKYTAEGGRISIHADVDDFGQMQISVTDTGIGLTDEEIEKALSPFGQVNTALNKAESGTGLGLTLVQSLMALHGGSFELFSQKGIGTTATLIFPPKRVSQQQAKTPERV